MPSGARLRLTSTLVNTKDIGGGTEVTVQALIEAEGIDKPVCTAEPLFRYYR